MKEGNTRQDNKGSNEYHVHPILANTPNKELEPNEEWQIVKSRKNRANPTQSNGTTGKEIDQRIL